MKVFFTTFFCTLFLFLCAQQKAPIKKNKTAESKNKTVVEKKVEEKKVEEKKIALISSRIVDNKRNPLKNVQIEIIEDSTNLVISTTQNENNGTSAIQVPLGKKYTVVFSKPNYLFQSIVVVIPDSAGYQKNLKDIVLFKVEVGKKIVLNGITFEKNQSVIRKESQMELDRIVKLMTDIPSLSIEVSGHTDNVGSVNYNRQFSEQKGKAVMDNLISKGCDKSRLTFKGYGSSQPFANNNTEKGRQQNSRVELKVLKADTIVEKVEEVVETKDTTSAAVSGVPKEEVKDTTVAIVPKKKEKAANTGQHEYIYHPIVKEPKNKKNTHTTKAEPVKETKVIKDTTVAVAKSADSTNLASPEERKDTTAVAVKTAETKDSTAVGQNEQVKDTTGTVVKQPENVDSSKIAQNQEPVEPLVKVEEPRIPAVHSIKMEIKNMGRQINSSFADYTPLVSVDAHTIIFTSRRPSSKKDVQKAKEGLEKVFVSYFDDKNEKWLEPRMLGSAINLPDVNNSAMALSSDGQQMLMYHAGTDLNSNGDIFESQLYTEEWSEPIVLPEPINSEDNETAANISPDGKTIYFVSDRKGGLGGKDIWYSTLDDQGKWGNAVNMGESINSAEDEESVFIHPSGNAIFFSSKGHNSMGGYDVFKSVYDEITKKWSKAESMGMPINSAEDDISFVLDGSGKIGYYASSRSGGIGGLDIYSITFFEDIMKANIVLLQGRVINKNGNSVGATITIKNKITGKISEPIKSNKTTGQYFISLPPGKKYEIKVSAYGYNPYVESIDIPYKSASEEIFKDIVLESKNAFISSRVLDEKGNPISNVTIEIVDKATNQLVAKPKSNSAGYSLVSVPFGKTYDVVFSKAGYMFQSVNTPVPDSVGYEKELKDITLQKVDVGKKMVLNSIFFDATQPVLRKESVLELQRVVKLMSEMATLQIEISGHTDNVGAIMYKKQISEQRAKAVVDNLVLKGCDRNRIKYVGLGPAQPLTINFTEEGRQTNNRIELKIIKVDLAAEQIAETKRLKAVALNPEKLEEGQTETALILEKPDENTEPSNEQIKTEIKNIGKLVNSPFADYAPLVSADNHTMTFTSRRPLNEKNMKKGKEGLENIYVTYYDDKNEKWQEPKMLEETVNLPNINNSAVALPNDGQQMLVYHCSPEVSANGDIFEHLIYGKEWTAPVRALSKPINSDDNETSASISPDGKTVYFVSDRKGGLGGKDIWYAVQEEDGIYGEAINMGPNVNTPEDEESVFMHPGGNTLFYSSKGHNSIGRYDIFMTTFDETTQKWSKSENFGLPVNTYGNDVYFTLSADGKSAHYASSKVEKLDDLDIYGIEFSEDILKRNSTLLKGRIVNKNKRPVSAMIVIKNATTGQVIDTLMSSRENGKYFIQLYSGKKYEITYSAYGYTTQKESLDIPYKTGYQKISKDIELESNSAFVSSTVLDERGFPITGVQIKFVDDISSAVLAKPITDTTGYTISAVPYGMTYEIVFGKFGYFFQSKRIVIPDSVGYELDLKEVVLRKVEDGKKFPLYNVFFDLNKAGLGKESVQELKQVAKLMKETVSLQLEIAAYTDSTGSAKNDQKLSEQRAKTVMDSIIQNGGDKKRLKYKGYGSTQPIAASGTEEGRKQNNRVELTVLKVDLESEKILEEKRIKDAIVVPIKKEKAPVVEKKEPVVEEPKKPPLSERLKKYDKDNNGTISYEELLMAMDSTRTELNKVLKPEEVKEKPPVKDSVAAPIKKEEAVYPTATEGQTIVNTDSVSTVIRSDSTGLVVTDSSGIKKAVVLKPMPERFKKYDKDNNGTISYDEILRVIDSFLDEDVPAKPGEKKDDSNSIAELLDYYFDQ